MLKTSPVIVIPAYNPKPTVAALVHALTTQYEVLLVDDGSQDPILFQRLAHIPRVTVLQHAENQGKGQALKTAFHAFLMHFNNRPGVICADADGQHALSDIQKVASAFQKSPRALWLGVRHFHQGVPWRSRLGNHLSRWLFRQCFGKRLQDTQTGLRAIPTSFLPLFMTLSSKGYEFELEMLIGAMRHHLPIQQIPIQTLYEADNASSHFRPLRDSWKIYLAFLKAFFRRRHVKPFPSDFT